MSAVIDMNNDISFLSAEGDHTIPLHTHAEYELLHYLEGYGALCSPHEDFSFSPGSIVLVPPNFLHGTSSKGSFKAIAIRGFENTFSFTAPLLICDNATRDAEALVHMIYRNRFLSADYLAALMNAYVHFILQNSSPEEPLTRAVRKIANEISERFSDSNISTTALLNESGYAEDYIRAHFKKIMDKTPNEFLTALRINHAQYLIEVYKGALSLSEISEQCGFSDYVYFSKKFKEKVGISPKEYKKQI